MTATVQPSFSSSLSLRKSLRAPFPPLPLCGQRAWGRVWLEEHTVLPHSAFIKLSPKMASFPHHKSSSDSQVYIAVGAHMGQETEGGEVLAERAS